MLLHISCTHRDNGHLQNTENVIDTNEVRSWKASNLLGGHLKTVQVFRESLASYITIHNQFKTIKFYGQQGIFFLLPTLLFNIKYYPFISSLILGFDPYIEISVLTSLYVQAPKKVENRNFLPFIWFSLLQASTFPYVYEEDANIVFILTQW